MSGVADKQCASCGRVMTWRKKWAANWDQIKYCSDKCRSRTVTAADKQLEAAILQLLSERGPDKTICPSDAARLVGSEEQWRTLMEPARAAARRLVAAEQVEITQKGHVVDASTAKGPIRIRLRRRS